MLRFIHRFSSRLRLPAVAVAILLILLVRSDDSPALLSHHASGKKRAPFRFPDQSPAQFRSPAVADADARKNPDTATRSFTQEIGGTLGEGQRPHIDAKIDSSAAPMVRSERLQLEQRAESIGRYAGRQVDRLARVLQLDPDQQDRIYTHMVSRASGFDPRMRIVVDGNTVALSSSMAPIEQGKEASSLEESIMSELDPAQKQAYADHLVDELKWWRDVFGTLHRNAQLSGSSASDVEEVMGGESELKHLSAAEHVAIAPPAEPIATQKENSRGRPNQLPEE